MVRWSGVKVVGVVRVVSLDDVHSENIWLSWSKPANYREQLRFHAYDIRTNGGKWKKGGPGGPCGPDSPGGPGGPGGQSGQDNQPRLHSFRKYTIFMV